MNAKEGRCDSDTQRGPMLPVEVALPPGIYNLRLAVRDNRTGYLGTLTAPITLGKP